ncbi:hypothetical protein SAMN02746091_02516 [Caloramator proteoclasticus DSM 10124]|uniref:Uncharacterized protein n=1 Tax=Caloramator proteoclasticus DSM 10124 TaxID=1121262 RepID=A0A1M5BLX7_9CLOT|nr:hypothetical protein SAMN02746091_02516 [Caloramator proteoclasticus DSM 10124]
MMKLLNTIMVIYLLRSLLKLMADVWLKSCHFWCRQTSGDAKIDIANFKEFFKNILL